ncbi:MAG: hypothetical protein DYG96_07305 [Chlorobi bacterium CHB2]|nr:hypothetical protein [Chlorobi bacterium CHB2]
MTRLGKPRPAVVEEIQAQIEQCCADHRYKVIDANSRITGRDFLLKIWNLIASVPLAIAIIHEDLPHTTQGNIYYELGVAQGLGKETLIVKSTKSVVPSDFIRTEYIEFDLHFIQNFNSYLKSLFDQARHYETVADQLERNPILAIDYLRRAFLITGDSQLRNKVEKIIQEAGLNDRARNSVELLAAQF